MFKINMALVVEKRLKKRRLSKSKRKGFSAAMIPLLEQKETRGVIIGRLGGSEALDKGRSAIHCHLNLHSICRLKIANVLNSQHSGGVKSRI